MLKGNDFVAKKLEDYLNEQMAKGTLQEGDRLLSERDIGKLFKVSGMAVHNAMKNFIERGILEKVPRKGTYIKKSIIPQKTTKRIGILFSHGGKEHSIFNNAFYSPIIAGIDRQARREKMNLSLTYLMAEGEERAGELLVEQLYDTDGIILLDLFPSIYTRIEKHLIEVQSPLVLLNYEGADSRIDTITMDSQANIRSMVDYLVSLGHRKIGIVYRQPTVYEPMHPNIRNRITAYRDAMENNNLPFNKKHIFHMNEPFFDSMLTSSNRPTALICMGDGLARKMYGLAEKAGMKIPDDLTITGHDGTDVGSRLSPPLTTISTPLQDMGALAVRRLVDKQAEQAQGITTGYRTVLPGTLTPRESHAAIR